MSHHAKKLALFKSKELKRLYNKFNRLWFKNQLPNIPIFGYMGAGLKLGLLGLYIGNENSVITKSGKKVKTLVQGPAILLRVDGNRTNREIQMALLHEMVHVKIGVTNKFKHSKYWHSSMRRLARIGAFDNLW